MTFYFIHRTIPSQGNKAELILTALHRNKLGLDEFLGQVALPLCDLDVYETPKSKWLRLESKAGKENKKERGELEVRISFTVKAGSLMDLSKVGKNKSSTSLANIGGSLLSLSTLDKRKKLKDFTKSLGGKNIFKRNSKHKSSSENISSGPDSRSPSLHSYNHDRSENMHDPGVISENEDEFIFETLSQKGSSSSLSFTKDNNTLNKHFKTLPHQPVDEWQQKLTGKRSELIKTPETGSQISLKNTQDSSPKPTTKEIEHKARRPLSTASDENIKIQSEPEPVKFETMEKVEKVERVEKVEKAEKKHSVLSQHLSKMGFSNNNKNKINEAKNERNNISRESVIQVKKASVMSEAISKKYEGLTRDELMLHAHKLENDVSGHKQKIKELEDYLVSPIFLK